MRKNELIDTFKVKCSQCGNSISIEDTFDSENDRYFCNANCRERWKDKNNVSS